MGNLDPYPEPRRQDVVVEPCRPPGRRKRRTSDHDRRDRIPLGCGPLKAPIEAFRFRLHQRHQAVSCAHGCCLSGDEVPPPLPARPLGRPERLIAHFQLGTGRPLGCR
jgi:hypothetical protein